MSKARVINARSFRIRATRAGLLGKQKVMSIFKTTEQFIKRALEEENPLQAEFALGYDHLNDAQWGVEMPMPWGYPEPDWPAAKTGQLEPVNFNEPHTACKAEMNLPVCAPESVQNQQASNSQADLEALLYSLDESGLRVSELKALPSGAMRITVDDLFGNHVREAEFVRVGG